MSARAARDHARDGKTDKSKPHGPAYSDVQLRDARAEALQAV